MPIETEHAMMRRWDRDAVPQLDQWVETDGRYGPHEAPGIQQLWVRYRHGGFARHMNREVTWNWQVSREKFFGHSDQNDAVAYQFVPLLPKMTPAEKRQHDAERTKVPFILYDGGHYDTQPAELHGGQYVDIQRRDGRIIAHCRVSQLVWSWRRCQSSDAHIMGYRPSPKD